MLWFHVLVLASKDSSLKPTITTTAELQRQNNSSNKVGAPQISVVLKSIALLELEGWYTAGKIILSEDDKLLVILQTQR